MAEGCDEGCLGPRHDLAFFLTVFSKCTGCKTQDTGAGQGQGNCGRGRLWATSTGGKVSVNIY